MVKREDYGIDEREVDFQTKEGEEWLNVPIDYDTVVANPLYKVLGEFKKSYIKNEQFSLEFFRQLASTLTNFDEHLTNFEDYADMDIVKLMQVILLQYRNWMLAMRANSFLAKDAMEEVLAITDDYYISKNEFEDFKEECEINLAESEEGSKFKIELDDVGKWRVPESFADGDRVVIKKIMERKG